ncbi:MAG TPA: GNAT family N-acetyltransferase [Gemmatimonadales bacterium]|nr:GNAT family N-acetyltransferase [Gemmatimonadales bacterium]
MSSWGVRDRLARVARRWEAARAGLTVHDVAPSSPEFQAALRALPETPLRPVELYQQLFEPRSDTPKWALLFEERGVPVAAIGARFVWDRWEPLTHWIVPGIPFPVRTADYSRVLQAVGLPLAVAGWRCGAPPALGPRAAVTTGATHGAPTATDFEAYWKASGHLHTVRQARARCGRFQLVVDPPGGAAWVIRNSGAKWREPAGVTEDRVVAAEWLERQRRYHTLMLLEGERRIAGLTFLVDGCDVVSHHTFRDPGFERLKVGTYLTDQAFAWARSAGFENIDLGGGFDYKIRWVPTAGQKYSLRLTPWYAAAGARLRAWWSWARPAAPFPAVPLDPAPHGHAT